MIDNDATRIDLLPYMRHTVPPDPPFPPPAPTMRCPRCARDVRVPDLTAVAALWVRADEDTATVWPSGHADIPAGVWVCAGCRDELRGYTRIRAGEREQYTPMLGIDIMDNSGWRRHTGDRRRERGG